MLINDAILCKKCLSIVFNRETCKCSNVGIIIDDDGIPHVYVNDITTTQRVLVYGDDVRRETLKSFHEAIYADYSVIDDPFYLKPICTRWTKKKKDPLIVALQRDYYKTSDGNEKRKGKL